MPAPDIVSARDLRARGWSDRRTARAVARGDLIRIRRGWYAEPGVSPARVAAVAHGGVLTGVSALAELGAWLLDPPQAVHIAVPAHASGRSADPPVVLHWEDACEPPHRPGVAGIVDALVRAALDEPLEVSVPCFDWALQTGRLDVVDYHRVLQRLPAPVRPLAAWVDGRSQSVLESVARVRLHQHGWAVRSQVRVGEVSAIDLVVEDHVALELDGRAFHESTFESDRRKDLAITIEGRHSLRVSMPILRGAWPDVMRAISAALAARRDGDAGKSGEMSPVARRKLRARGSTGATHLD